ncbi:zinc ABC transporter substrate-binding protein ZnuA [Maricurvus nonylphenolicus]|uniref:metal ABC transporter solute-binding protein, Zn/Mn family n=1 Tax=Maricurvus nonylphenolicus TaxID=1008307 RepID=UPI0036F20680
MFRVIAAVCGLLFSFHVIAEKPLQVVTSIQPLALIAKTVLPSETQYRVLVPNGGNPHSYALKVSDRQAIANADLVLWIGPQMERFLAKVMKQSTAPSIAMAELDSVTWPEESHNEEVSHHHGHDHSGQDMHMWLNPNNALELVAAIGRVLEVNAGNGVNTIASLDKSVSEQLHVLKDLNYGVYHDAYSHFTAHYRLSDPIVVSPGEDSRPGARHLHKIRQQLKGGDCLFVAPGQTNGLSLQVSRAANIPLVKLDPLQADSYTQLITAMADAFVECGTGK